MTAKSRLNKTKDFGFDPDQSEHHFLVQINRSGEVEIYELRSYADDDQSDVAEPQLKVRLSEYHWAQIEQPARTVFNERLRRSGHRAANWKKRQTRLAATFGKELLLLAWAVEDADPTLIPSMVANWNGLAPEERWWLYTTVNATSGHPEHGKDRGWRKAIKIAFSENPVDSPPPSSLISQALPVDAEDALVEGRGSRRTKRKTRLADDDEGTGQARLPFE